MSNQQAPVLIFEMFPFLTEVNELSENFSTAYVSEAVVDKTRTSMRITLQLAAPVPPVDITVIEDAISEKYSLNSVNVTSVYKRRESKKTSKRPEKIILGRAIRERPIPISQISLELGKAAVRGEVCDVTSKEIPKRGAWVLSFDVTDYTSTVRVSKFMPDPGAKDIVEKIQKGMTLTVSGRLNIDRYYGDLTLEPVNISVHEKPVRRDTAEDKRVELHAHTKMSAMDAVTDTSNLIKRAISWGHRAIAITDHGVVHSFPDAMNAAGDKIKVIYGVEAYFINDVDDVVPVYGDCSGSFESEYVVFDIETTGLSAIKDKITEIGAVLVRDGTEISRFQTFVNPGVPIPAEIMTLTGITDADVKDAPGQAEAIKSFLEFVADRPLVAHNGSFDVGFISEQCLNFGIVYTPKYIDTLAIARVLLPNLKNHKLNTLAAFFNLPDFTHHRAVDDAVTTQLCFERLLEKLRKLGVSDFSQIPQIISERRNARRNAKHGRIRPRHIILLAKNQTGIKNLYKLVTKSHLEHFERYPIVPKSVLLQHREGIIVGSACEAGEIFSLITRKSSTLELKRIAELYDYLEIQPIQNNMFMLKPDRARASSVDELCEYNRRVVELGATLNKPVCATGDVHFLDPEHELYRRVLLTAKGFDNSHDELPIYFKSTDEMLREFSYLGESCAYDVVVKNPCMIADMCEIVRPLPPAKTLFSPKIEGSAEELKKLVYGRMQELYGPNSPELVKTRVDTELGDILGRNYDVIYITAQKLVADSLAHGYLVGSRGSVGSSLVAYLAGITEVNSLPAHYRCPTCRHSDFTVTGYGCGADMPDSNCPNCGSEYVKDGFDIPFETFLGFGGDKVPDIDLNFSGEYQARAHKYTNDLFGADHVFRAGTIGTVAEKTAFGYVKKYLESLECQVSRAEENRLAQGCVGVKRTTGQHPGGLIVIPQNMEISDFCPAQRPADDSETDVVTTHFDYHCMEDNLLKLDELGHDDPTMIKMLEDLTGINAQKIKLDDRETMGIFKSPEPLGLPSDDEVIGPVGSIGIPEFGTGFTRQMLCDTQPETFDTLVRLSGFSHGTDVWLGNAKDIITNKVADISQTIGCRDDIMLFLISKGMTDKFAFKIMESVRKGRGLPDGAEQEMRNLSVPEWYIESCKKIKYLFPKAHAVAYVMMAFRIAWFKVHRPLAFYSAYFYRRSQKDSFDAEYMIRGIDVVSAKIKEIRANTDAKAKEEDMLTTLEACYEFYMRGFSFERIDIYESDAVKFLPVGDTMLRPPFVAISGLGETAARDLANGRKQHEFISVDDLMAVCSKVSKTHIEQLKTLGALRGLPETSQISLF